jgi:hypothetical protein
METRQPPPERKVGVLGGFGKLVRAVDLDDAAAADHGRPCVRELPL